MPRFPLHRTLGPLGVQVAAQKWYLAGGISASNAIAAYAPKGAASLAASYTNLANPGTNDAAPKQYKLDIKKIVGTEAHIVGTGILDVRPVVTRAVS